MSKYKKERVYHDGYQNVAVYTNTESNKAVHIAPANKFDMILDHERERLLDKEFGEVGERIKPPHC